MSHWSEDTARILNGALDIDDEIDPATLRDQFQLSNLSDHINIAQANEQEDVNQIVNILLGRSLYDSQQFQEKQRELLNKLGMGGDELGESDNPYSAARRPTSAIDNLRQQQQQSDDQDQDQDPAPQAAQDDDMGDLEDFDLDGIEEILGVIDPDEGTYEVRTANGQSAVVQMRPKTNETTTAGAVAGAPQQVGTMVSRMPRAHKPQPKQRRHGRDRRRKK